MVHGMDPELPYGTAEDPEAEYIIAEEVKKREAGMKYFLTERNGHVAVLYPEPVHYQTDDGWEEIDNRLVLTEDAGTGEEAYENAASDVKVSLARYSDAEELVSLEWDGRRISWSLVTELEEEENGEETEPSGETAAEEPSGQKENAETAAEKPSGQKEKTEAAEETAGSKHGEPVAETVKETTEPEQGETVKESEEQGEPADEPAGKPAETQKPEESEPGSRSQSSGQAVKPARREFLPQTPLYETETGGESSSHGAGVSDEAGEDDTAVSPAGSILPEIPEGWPEIPVPDEWKKVTKERDGLAADRYNAQVAGVPNLSSGGIYQEVFPGVDLQYRIDSVTLKENIFLNDRDAAGQTIRFRIHHPGMRMVLSGEGEVQLVTGEGEGEAYTFLRPYMYDAAGETSNAVAYELLESGEDETVLTVSADQEWLLAESRTYPVTIDPNTETKRESRMIIDTFIREKQPGETDSGWGSAAVGYVPSYGRCRILVKFKELPALDAGDVIYKGVFAAHQYKYDASAAQSFPVTVHEPLSDWDQTVTWNSQPSCSDTVLDFKTAKPIGDQTNLLEFDVTKLVRKWYNTGNNYGIELRSRNETQRAEAYVITSNNNFGEEAHPCAYFYYKNAAGLEGYWSYHEQDAGRAGHGYTNDFNGNLVFVHPDAATSGSRLPVTVSHVYNLCDTGKSSRIGNGWRLNVQERLLPTGISDSLYVYTDGDGTRHFFYRDEKDGNKLKDEDGLGFVITREENQANVHEYRLLTGKDKSVRTFDVWGYLKKKEDPNGNSIQYYYDSDGSGLDNYLGTVVDGAGQAIDFAYEGTYKDRLVSITDRATGRKTSYGYDGDGNLTSITYPDGSKSTYSYDQGRLVRVKEPNGSAVAYGYLLDQKVPRVLYRQEEGEDGSRGNVVWSTYADGNRTWFQYLGLDRQLGTADDPVYQYDFDSAGQPLSVHDKEGNASAWKYYGQEKGAHLLKESGHLRKTVRNYLSNPGFTPGKCQEWDSWYTYAYEAALMASVDRVGDLSHWTTNSVRVAHTKLEAGRPVTAQNVLLSAGTYTFSAFARTSDVVSLKGQGNQGAIIGIDYLGGSLANRTNASRALTGTSDPEIGDGWQRLFVTFTVPEDNTWIRAWCGLNDASGTAWFDDAQLEEGETCEGYNLIQNGSFEGGSQSGNVPSVWTVYSESGWDGASSDAHWNGSSSGRLSGDPGTYRNLSQLVYAGGAEGDCYSLSAWAYADAVPEKDFYLEAQVCYSNGTTKSHRFDFDPYVKGWQYGGGVFTTDDGNADTKNRYYAINIRLVYDDQCNAAWFDGVQLTKDEGETYVYDKDGNLTDVKSAAEQSKFRYDGNGNLSGMVSPDGTDFSYTYDSRNNLTEAKNSDGAVYRFSYDACGNPVSSSINAEGTGTGIHSSQTYDPSGKQVLTVTDELQNTTTYQYDSTGRLLTGTTDAEGRTVTYAYDNRDRTTKMAETVTDGNGESHEASITYQYEKDRLSAIGHNGFFYTFTYDAYGKKTGTAAGGNTILTETYQPANGSVTGQAYANGDTVSYAYNAREELESISHNGTKAFTYQYDSAGNEIFHEDLLDQTRYFFDYDSLGRVVRMATSRGQSLELGYDTRARTDRLVSLIDGEKTTTGYRYGAGSGEQPSLVYGVRIDGKETVTYAYDGYGRTTSRTVQAGTPYRTSYGFYQNPDGTDTTRAAWMEAGGTKTSYEYDTRGNITRVFEGGTEVLTYTYDELGELLRADDRTEGKSHAWSYDAGGNRTEERIYPYTTGTLGEPETTISYGYGAEGWKDQLTEYDGQTITYDAIGNPLSYRDGMAFGWQHGRELKSLTAGGRTTTYTYDEDGYRMTKADESGVTRYYRNGTTLLTQKKGSTRLDFFYDANGLPLGFKKNGTVYYYILNLQGDVVGILDSEGTQVAGYRYDSWGKLLSCTGELADSIGAVNPLRYRGYYYDSESGLYYLNSRYYDPETGRFLNADWQMDDNAGLLKGNLYVYCANNPVKNLDEAGEWLLTAATMLVGAVVNVASTAIAAATTGQKYTWADAAIAAGTGAIGASRIGAVGAAIFGGIATAWKSRKDGRSMGESVAIGVTTAIGTLATFSNMAKLPQTNIGAKMTAIATDGIFSVGYNMIAAAFTKPKSGSSKRKTETTKVSKAKSKTSKSRQRFEQRRYWNRALRQWRYYYVKV